jgi:diguanylate cyclase (GGDEF)-like protein
MVQGAVEFGLDGTLVEIGDRRWGLPEVLPDRPPEAVFDLRTPLGRIGHWSAWAQDDRNIHNPWLDEMFQCIALVLEGVLHLEASDLRSRIDPLTSLLNRDGLAMAMRDIRPPYAVAMVDVDNFKLVNDVHGHEVGDRFLIELGRLLSAGRASDLVARWGGEEMVVVMPDTEVEAAAVALRRLLDDAGRTILAENTCLSFSAGVAGVVDEYSGLADGIRAADQAMYVAKRNGRGRVVVAT